MTKVDIFSGFLGAGKTTLIKKLIKEAYPNEKLVLIENEFGDIGIDGGFMKDSGVTVNELSSGCICCSLVGDFGDALKKVIFDYSPDRILIEPSGVGKLSDVIRAVTDAGSDNLILNSATTIIDAKKCMIYMKNFGEFYNNQVINAETIILSHTDTISDDKLLSCTSLLREINKDASFITTPWDELNGNQILDVIEKKDTLSSDIENLTVEDLNDNCCPVCGHHHDDDHDDDDECSCAHDHHHHDDDDDECSCDHDHHHDDDHDDECSCGHHHNHHHGHDADEIFVSCGMETPKRYTDAEILSILGKLGKEDKYGAVLRAKGIIASTDGSWIHFDYIPDSPDIRRGSPAATGRFCVIGSQLKSKAIMELFGV